mgnify:CR=1 FL=1
MSARGGSVSEIERAGREHCSTGWTLQPPQCSSGLRSRPVDLATKCSPTSGSCSGSTSLAIRWRLIPAISTVRRSHRSLLRSGSKESSTVRLAGIVCSVEKKFTKKDGKPFAVIVLEDFTGQMELTAWDDVFADIGLSAQPWSGDFGLPLDCTRRDDSIRAIISALCRSEAEGLSKACPLHGLPEENSRKGLLPDILDAVRRFPGKRPLIIEIVNDAGLTFEIPQLRESGGGRRKRETLSTVSRLPPNALRR